MSRRRPGDRRARRFFGLGSGGGRRPALLGSGTGGLLIAGILAGVGCRPRPTPPPLQGDRISLSIESHALRTEVVFDNVSRHQGLMHRQRLPRDDAMLFVFDRPEPLGFWMKNTHVPLSIAFLDDEGTILQIEDMMPEDLSTTRSKYKTRFALEVNQGWFREAGIGVGARFGNFRERVARYAAAAEPRR